MNEQTESRSLFQSSVPIRIEAERDSWLAGLMNSILLAFIICTSLITAACFVTIPQGLSLLNRSTLISSVTLVYYLAMFLLLKQGFPRPVAFLSSFYLHLLATYVIFSGYGLHDMVIVLYPVLFLISSLFLSRFSFALLTLLTVILVVLIGIWEIQGILVSKTSFITTELDIALIAIILSCTAVLIRFLTEKLLAALGGARKNAANYKEIFNATSDAVFIINPVSYLATDINLAAVRMFGLTAENASATRLDSVISDDPPGMANRALQYLKDYKLNETDLSEWRVKDASGRTFFVETFLETIIIDGNTRILAALRDITLRKKAEEEGVYLQNYLKNVIDSMPSVIIGVDADIQVTRWNQKAEETTGLNEDGVMGNPLEKVVPQLKDDIFKVRQAIKNMEVLRIQHERNPDETFGEYTDMTIFPLVADTMEGAVIRIDDVTEIRKTQEVMIQTEKMMSVGGLAAGMAHEINNPLGAMMQSAQNIQRRLSPSLQKNVAIAEESGLDLNLMQTYLEKRSIYTFINGIRDAGNRAAKIIANMLQFSRRSESNMAPIKINQLLDQTIELAYNDYDLKKRFDFRQVELQRSYNPELPPVPCMETEIEQVILNLLRNASQAMFESSSDVKPRIEIKTDFDDRFAHIEVTDNGPGVPEEIQHRVFEPFFTTKPVGDGTGLGLSVSYMIITQNHKGTMTLSSRPENGSQFTISLPLQHDRV